MERVTVLMPVYNAAPFIRRAIESVLSQSFRDFEFLIIDDGSTDDSQSIVKSYSDSRIRLVQNEENMGVAKTLNRGLGLAAGEYIARMDGDDVCEPDRLELQVRFMEDRPGLALSGTFVRRFAESGNYVLRFPQGSTCLRSYVLLGNPLAHPTVIFRREVFVESGFRYDPECKAAQDYDLWSRCLRTIEADNLPAPLVHWRATERSVTSARFAESNRQALRIQQAELVRLGIAATEEQLAFHRQVGNGSGFACLEGLERADHWLRQLIEKNREVHVYPDEGLQQAAAFVWFRVCLNSSGLGPAVRRIYSSSPVSEGYCPAWRERLMMWANAALRLRRQPAGRLPCEERA